MKTIEVKASIFFAISVCSTARTGNFDGDDFEAAPSSGNSESVSKRHSHVCEPEDYYFSFVRSNGAALWETSPKMLHVNESWKDHESHLQYIDVPWAAKIESLPPIDSVLLYFIRLPPYAIQLSGMTDVEATEFVSAISELPVTELKLSNIDVSDNLARAIGRLKHAALISFFHCEVWSQQIRVMATAPRLKWVTLRSGFPGGFDVDLLDTYVSDLAPLAEEKAITIEIQAAELLHPQGDDIVIPTSDVVVGWLQKSSNHTALELDAIDAYRPEIAKALRQDKALAGETLAELGWQQVATLEPRNALAKGAIRLVRRYAAVFSCELAFGS